MEIYDKKSFNMNGPYCRFKIRKCSRVLSDGGENSGTADWRNGRRRARLLLHAQRDGPPRARGCGCLTPVELDYSRRSCKRSTYEAIMK